MTPDDFFVFSVGQKLPDLFFRGHAFFEEDFVIGESGLRNFESERQRCAEIHEDGRYFLLRKEGSDHVAGTDFNGTMKLFLYRDSSKWALSNSFSKLLDFVRAAGWRITPQPEHLNAWLLTGPFWQQLWSFKTAVDEIELVPAQAEIRISRSEIKLTMKSTKPTAETYEQAMIRFISLWVNRTATLISTPGIFVKSDITGGVDSRINLALIMYAQSKLGLSMTNELTFNCGKHGRHREDFKVAERLSKFYRFPLNKPLSVPVSWRSSRECFEMWRLSSLGAYSPVYFPDHQFSEKLVNIGGGGGERHRPFYPNTDIDTFFHKHEDKFVSEEFFQRIKIDVKEALERIFSTSDTINPMIAHYREFRDRLHSGLLANYSIRISPLGSKYLQEATSFKSSQEIARNQVLFDAMNALIPDLLTRPYDNPKKEPAKECLDTLLLLPKCEVLIGKTFQGSGHERVSTKKNDRRPIDHLAEHLSKIAKRNLASDAAMKTAVQQGKFSHPVDAKNIHATILENEISC
ncbi:hypothetical protein [Roseovarius sp. SYSU LYC5161]|uniref:hypothetical protein n=1 Tax=Roseovarius halophilus (ex Wu et al. 2025) TaxID=3376060 RepID=UPI00399AC852